MTSSRPITIRTALSVVAVALLLLAPFRTTAQSNAEPEEFNAFAVSMGAYAGTGTANLIFTVNRWSSEGEREKIFAALREKGPQAMVDEMQRTQRVGTIRTAQSVGYDLRFAMQEPGKDGGRRVILATDRPINFYEATNRPFTIEYPFTIVDMQLPSNPKEKGKGTLSLAARIIPAGKNVVIENYDTQPVQLNNIEVRKLTKR
jgi:hypothetical protein